ncbi:MAG TPA: glycosyltransferase, partial [Gemmataceae bacterium]|nr:glycosyltransferase [Gemmataceae bacterium]
MQSEIHNLQSPIDLLLVGLPHPHLEREALARLRQWARLGERYRVVCAPGNREEIARQIGQARVVLVRKGRRGTEWVPDCARQAGAILMAEEEASPRDLEQLLDGKPLPGCRAAEGSGDDWDDLLGIIAREREQPPAVAGQLSGRLESLLARCRQVLEARAEGDPGLIGDLTRHMAKEPGDATLHVALGLAMVACSRQAGEQAGPPAAALGSAVEEFRRALIEDSNHVMARLNLVEGLLLLGDQESAAREARTALAVVDRARDEDFLGEGAGHLSALACKDGPDEFTAAWERAVEKGDRTRGGEGSSPLFQPRVPCPRYSVGMGGISASDMPTEYRGHGTRRALVRWRLHVILAELTGASSHFFEAALAFPDSPTTRAALGSAVARAGKVAEAVDHLRLAVEANPLDLEAARNLYHAVGETLMAGAADNNVRPTGLSQRRLARDMWLLAKMIPTLPKEAWFENAAPAGDELASIIIPCWNQADMTRGCLESLVRHTRTPFEIILIDNGSSDGTAELCAEFAKTVERVSNRLGDLPVGNRHHENPYLQRFEVIRNETNLGFAAATNQGLARARGSYLVLLNNDTVVTESWLERLIECSLARWPKVGMVGPVSNYAPPPQLVRPEYDDLDALGAFARRRAAEFQGQALPVPRLTGFCLLLRREVYVHLTANDANATNVGWVKRTRADPPTINNADPPTINNVLPPTTANPSNITPFTERWVGASTLDPPYGTALDERFGMGFFEDDDLCFRARDAGYELLVALDVYIHHHGSTTFKAAGIETGQLLRENFEKFQAKWGRERTAPYQMPEEQKKETGVRRQETGENTDTSLGSSLLTPVSCLLSPSVSLCMIVKNEEDNLPACLASVSGLTDEIIVVDTGSTDRTREIARDAGAKVFEFPWVDSFSAARNESIRHASGQWIFWMDADDRLDDENREKLKRLFASLGKRETGEDGKPLAAPHSSLPPPVSCLLSPVSCFVMKCLCLPDRETGTATVVDHVRLFRNDPRIRWRYRIHEQILIGVRLAGGEARWSDVVIHHTGYQDPARRGPKLERDVR